MKNTFTKAERLCRKISINKLFGKGNEKSDSVFHYPFRVVYQNTHNLEIKTHQIIISVSKRSFKKAVDRNLIKRRTREAYRLNKSILNHESNDLLALEIGFVYIGKEILEYKLIESKLITILEKIKANTIEKNKDS